MTTSSHLELAIQSLEEATIHFSDAVRAGEFMNYHAYYLDRLDLLKRATANLTTKMREEATESAQEELVFG
jgi:hypothetical protein